MRESIARRLIELNHAFYAEFAAEFSRSRSRLQPGIPRALLALSPFESLLDLGCGDGRVGRALRGGLVGPWAGRYVGVDASAELLGEGASYGLELLLADFTATDWSRELALEPRSFDAAVCLSVLHHIPSHELRLRTLQGLAALLRPGGHAALSVWQLLHQDRFRRKVRPWSEAGLEENEMEAGDVLLDWQRGGRGLRYVHEFGEVELRALCQEAGLHTLEVYREDGGLGLYILLSRP